MYKFNRKQRSLITQFVKQFHNKEHVNLTDVFMAIAFVVKTGLPLCVITTPANVHDSQSAKRMLEELHNLYPSVSLVKADRGYRGTIAPKEMVFECVKSNLGTTDFVPFDVRFATASR